MYAFAILLLVIWLWMLLGHGSYRSTLPLSYRIQNILLSLLLVFSSSIGIFGFWSRVFHPNLLPAFFMRESAFPPVIGFVIVLLSVCAAHLEMLIGCWMAQQKRRARTLVMSVVPFLLAVEILSIIHTSAKFRSEVVAVGLAIFIPLTIGFFVWLYFFCRSKQTEELMTNAG